MRSRIKTESKRATATSSKTPAKKAKSPGNKKGGFGAGSDRNDYYQNDQDTYDYTSSRMGMRSDRDSDFDYEAEDRSRDEYNDREEIRTRDNLGGLSGGYGRSGRGGSSRR